MGGILWNPLALSRKMFYFQKGRYNAPTTSKVALGENSFKKKHCSSQQIQILQIGVKCICFFVCQTISFTLYIVKM